MHMMRMRMQDDTKDKCNTQEKYMATTTNNWKTPGASDSGRHNTPPLQEDLIPRSRTERTPDIRNGGDPRAPRWLLGRNGVTTSLSGI